MCVFANHPCFAAHRLSLFRRVRERWKTFPFFMGPHVCWQLLSPLAARWCVFRGSFPSAFFSTSWFLVILAFPVCPGLPTVALWVSWPVLLRFCVGRLVLRNVCRTLSCLTCFLPGASPRALLLRGSYSSGLVTCRCLAPARHVGLSRFVSAWPCPVKPFSPPKINKNENISFTPHADHMVVFFSTLLTGG
jgi:hypothetical protein